MVKVRGLGGLVSVRVKVLTVTEVQGCESLCVFVSVFLALVHLLMRETHKRSLV